MRDGRERFSNNPGSEDFIKRCAHLHCLQLPGGAHGKLQGEKEVLAFRRISQIKMFCFALHEGLWQTMSSLSYAFPEDWKPHNAMATTSTRGEAKSSVGPRKASSAQTKRTRKEAKKINIGKYKQDVRLFLICEHSRRTNMWRKVQIKNQKAGRETEEIGMQYNFLLCFWISREKKELKFQEKFPSADLFFSSSVCSSERKNSLIFSEGKTSVFLLLLISSDFCCWLHLKTVSLRRERVWDESRQAKSCRQKFFYFRVSTRLREEDKKMWKLSIANRRGTHIWMRLRSTK